MNKQMIPGCTYCSPQVASVGLTEQAAKEKKLDIRVGRFPFVGNGKAIALGEDQGLVKVIFDKKTGQLLGAHMVGAEVTELIQGYVVAMNLETTEEELMHTIFPHPTLSEMMKEAVLDAYGRVFEYVPRTVEENYGYSRWIIIGLIAGLARQGRPRRPGRHFCTTSPSAWSAPSSAASCSRSSIWTSMPDFWGNLIAATIGAIVFLLIWRAIRATPDLAAQPAAAVSKAHGRRLDINSRARAIRKRRIGRIHPCRRSRTGSASRRRCRRAISRRRRSCAPTASSPSARRPAARISASAGRRSTPPS